MNRPLLGLCVGAGLGVLDGLSALVSSPEVSDGIAGIVVGSAGKGLLAGVIVGLIARKLTSSKWSTVIGMVLDRAPERDALPARGLLLEDHAAGRAGRGDRRYVVMRYGKAPQQRPATA